jgi:hypothetical protein
MVLIPGDLLVVGGAEHKNASRTANIEVFRAFLRVVRTLELNLAERSVFLRAILS